MTVEGDEFIAVPDPPPPRPAARQAAIEAALRKFDGVEETQAAPSVPGAQSRKWWSTMHRRPAGALAAAALIAVISVPVALIVLRDEASNLAPPVREPTAAQPAQDAATGTPPAEQVQNAPTNEVQVADEVASSPQPSVQSPDVGAPAESASTPKEQMAIQGEPAPAIASAAPPPPPPPPAPSAPPARATAEQYSDVTGEESMVVTGSRIPAPKLEKQRSSAAERAAESPGPVAVPDAYGVFLSRLQAAFRRNDRGAVIGLVVLPLRVRLGDRTVTYRSTADVERDFEVIFTPEVRRSVLGQRRDALRSRGTRSMGNGRIWFGPSKGSAIGITEVNP